MPVNSILDKRKGGKNKEFQNNTFLRNEELNEPPTKICNKIVNKENRPQKRPSNGIYHNTLNASKKLKTLDENQVLLTIANRKESTECELLDFSPAMLNGHHSESGQYSGNAGTTKKNPIATLSNLGNTCFLNSVLYTLRYAPRFLHNLHHLVSDLANVEQKLGSVRLKSSSLGRSAVGLASSGTRSWSSKDLLTLGQVESKEKSKIQVATEKLHETYTNLRSAESKCLNSNSLDANPEPYAADGFLSALREVNSTFEGNKQQDAHELLVCILDHIRETCRALSVKASRIQTQVENGARNGVTRQPSLDSENSKTSLANFRKSWKKKSKDSKLDRKSPTEERAPSPDPEKDERNKPGWDFVTNDFEGTMVVRTMCLECETVTENKQAICDICIPVADEGEAPLENDETDPIKAACLSCDYLRDQNKYWCSKCLRYNEARRSVAYSRLPRLLVLQLKRFSGGMEKITKHATTPLLMSCFCESCCRSENPHKYTLWAVIMHLGLSLTGGHYVAYTRDTVNDFKCDRENVTDSTNLTSSSFMKTLFTRPKPSTSSGCIAKDCCVVRPKSESNWLACDDDLVKPISNEEFEDLLSADSKVRTAATPYLLFYVKNDMS